MEDLINRTDLIRKLKAYDNKANGIPNYAWKIIKEMPSQQNERENNARYLYDLRQ